MRSKFLFSSLVIFMIISILNLSACDKLFVADTDLTTEERAQTAIAETIAVENYVQTVVAGTMAASRPSDVDESQPEPDANQVPEPIDTDTPEPTITPTATITLTPTPDKPMVSVSVDTNCRTGPGTVYDIVGALLVGETAEVVAMAADGGYWIIKNTRRGGECWLWSNYATVVGETSALPKYTPPPTPTPVYNWSGNWTTSFGKPNMQHETIIFTLAQTGTTVTGSFTFGPDIVTLSGTLSADLKTLTGTWTALPTSGPFSFKLVSANQFVGNKDNGSYEWCGYRSGAGLPSPCMGP